MAPSSTPPQLAHFTRLNTSVWYHRPSALPTTSSTSRTPDLILLVGWMDASARHLSKYTSGYETLFPSSSILAITTTSLDAILWSEASTVQRISPALEILYGLDDEAKVLVHLFSDGGSFTTTRIAMAYQERMESRLPMTAMILDSSPGRASYPDTVRAFAVSLPRNPVVQVVGGALLRVGWGLYVLGYMAQGKENMVEVNRRMLNDQKVFRNEARRLYLYSEGDQMVRWEMVEQHAAEAEGRGWVVERENFGESGHCGHMVLDGVRYWVAVKRVWDAAIE